MLAIGESPAVVLHMGKFHARRAGGFRECQHFRELLDVAPVDHEVEGDGDAASFQPFERAKLLRVGFRAGDFRCDFLARALEAELQMIEAGSEERVELGFVEGKAGGDEIDVQAGGAGGADQFDDVGAGERFATGEVGLQDAEFRGLLENARPSLGVEFRGAGLQLEGIRAVDAV